MISTNIFSDFGNIR